MDDDDLFAVFDSESSKSQQIVIPDEDEKPKDEKLDSNALVAQICGTSSKRPVSKADEEDAGTKKFKTDAETTLMTGLSDAEVAKKMDQDDKQVQGIRDDNEPENIEEDETVVNLVEAAPR